MFFTPVEHIKSPQILFRNLKMSQDTDIKRTLRQVSLLEVFCFFIPVTRVFYFW